MLDKITPEDILNTIVETISETGQKPKSVLFFGEDKSNTVSSKINRLFGRQKPVYNLLGGGQSADVLLWRNKKISASVLGVATVVWVLFEWLNYHFLTLVAFALVLGLLAQFILSNASGLLNRSSSRVPRLVLPEELFASIGMSVGAEVNRGLGIFQDISCGGNLKQLLVVIGSLLAAAVIGSWCNFLTVLYVGFVGAHTLPVLYEKYEDEVDGFVYKMGGHLQTHYTKLDAGFLSKIPKGNLSGKKYWASQYLLTRSKMTFVVEKKKAHNRESCHR